MICNTDIIFEDNSFIEQFLSKTYDDSVWCVGTSIILKRTGKNQNPFLRVRPTSAKVHTWRIFYSSYPLFRLYFKLHDIKKRKNASTQEICCASGYVYGVHGSCFFVTEECVNQLVPEAQGIFMYGEELLVAEVIRHNAKKIYYDSSLKIVHNENQVTSAIASSRKQKWFNNSFVYMYNQYFKNKLKANDIE
jgi:GT2 family glycosyltransferase